MRLALTAYLALLMVAAPCLCCCTPARLAAASAEAAEEPVATCCHHARPEPQPAPTPPSNPDPQNRCPCREHSQKQAVIGTGEMAPVRHDIGPFHAVPPVALPDGADFRAQTPSFGLHCTNPFPTAFDLLHVHHRLRC